MQMDAGGTGTPWLDQPVMLHSSRADKCSLNAEQCAFRSGFWRYWYEADHVYALSTVYLFIAAIGACLLGFCFLKFSPSSAQRQGWWQKLVGLFRFLAYRRWRINALAWTTPSAGVLFLLVVGFVFFFAMTLGPQPYYWPNTRTLSYGGSPPIATRTGWMALACLPFILVFATKANMIASLTGVSHERLMVFHICASWAMFVLALIHTFPFIIFHIWKGDMVTQWNTSVVYWTGVVAIIPQAYLTFMSIPWIRNKYYEFFKATHYIAAVVFIVFFFIHCDFRLTSWDYFIAAGVLYAVSFLYSQIRTYFEHGVSLRATIVPVSDLAFKITIPIEHATWRPGQHMFLRFVALGLHAFTAHPFTICSSDMPVAKSTSGKQSGRALTFYVKQRGGLTGRLASAAAKQSGLTVPVLVDGPYGGLQTRPLHTYDSALVIGCGIGAGFSLPFVMEWILASSRAASTDESRKRRKHMKVLLTTRDPRFLEWYEAALLDFLEANELPTTLEGVEIIVHYTSSGEIATPVSSRSQEDVEDTGEKQKASAKTPAVGQLPFKILQGRPDVSAVVRETTAELDATVGIAVCGTEGVLKAAQDEAAAAQLRILGSGAGAKEVYLHSELFSW